MPRLMVGLTVFAIVLVAIPVDSVFAAYCSGTYKGRDGCQGYFSGDNASANAGTIFDLIDGGTSATGPSAFITQIDNALTGNDGQNSVGAAFIIANMLGMSGTDFTSQANGQTWARNNFNRWRDLVNAYDSAGYIDWSKSISTATAPDMGAGSGEYRNSAWFSDIDDSAFHNKDDETITVIEIVTPGGGYFRLERKCLNLVGTLTALEPLPATIDPQVLVNGQGNNNVVVDAYSGNTTFLHRIVVTNYRGMNHDVEWSVEQSINTDETCNAPYTSVDSGTLAVTANGTFPVWGPANVAWDRDTTKRVCQRLNIVDRDGATLTPPNPQNRWVTVRSGAITFGVSSSPTGIVEPGAPFSMDGWVRALPESGNSFPLTYSIAYTSGVPGVVPPAAKSKTENVAALYTDNNPFSGTIPINAPAGGEICITVTVSEPTQSRYFSGVARSDTICLKVVYKPVFHVNGGDVLAGASVNTGSCDPGPSAIIGGWNTNSGPSYIGAGTRFAAFATGEIKGFATARDILGVSAPSGLAFANIGYPSGETYGGNFGRAPCISDQWTGIPTSTATIDPLNVGSGIRGVYKLSGNSIGDNIINAGVQQIIYVDGNLTITGNIQYNRNPAGWLLRKNIPAVKFVVSGDIVINNAVTLLDGVYAAKGSIYTCEYPTDGTMYNGCNNKLVVNGALISANTTNGINFKRTFGSVRTASPGNVAEEINYRPEVWMANWPQIDGSGEGFGKYDAITALPPVL